VLADTLKFVTSAIQQRRRLAIRYNGQVNLCVIEPHILYRTQDGMLALVAYQKGSYQSSVRRGTFWRPFQLKRIDKIYATDEPFSPRVRQGYETVAALIAGEILAKLDLASDEHGTAELGMREQTAQTEISTYTQAVQNLSGQNAMEAG